MNPYEPTRFQIRRLRIYEAGCFLIVLTITALVILVYALGSSNRWEPITDSTHAGVMPEADDVLLVGDGDWLVWVASGMGNSSRSSTAFLSACDLNHPGQSVLLRPPPNAGIRPIEVIEGDLIALVTVPQTSLWQVLQRGWTGLTRTAVHLENTSPDQNPGLLPGFVTVQLQRVNLLTGRVITTASGGTYELGTTEGKPDASPNPSELTDFERGNVSLSPDRLNMAWWSAREEVGKSPLSATVTERLEILSTGPRFEKLLEKEICTDGALSVRSRLLEQTGQPVWMNNDRCLVFSTLDSGSLIPFDCGEGSIEATVPLPALQQTLTEGAPVSNQDPEGFEVLPEGNGHGMEVLVWTRLPGSLHLFLLDPTFHLIHHAQVEDKNLDLSRTLWLKRSQVLLFEDTSSSRLVGFTPKGEREGVYPIPPDWEDGFRILGENRDGDLIGYNRGSFLSTKSGDGAWETMELFR
jgi:hypothetical protein